MGAADSQTTRVKQLNPEQKIDAKLFVPAVDAEVAADAATSASVGGDGPTIAAAAVAIDVAAVAGEAAASVSTQGVISRSKHRRSKY